MYKNCYVRSTTGDRQTDKYTTVLRSNASVNQRVLSEVTLLIAEEGREWILRLGTLG